MGGRGQVISQVPQNDAGLRIVQLGCSRLDAQMRRQRFLSEVSALCWWSHDSRFNRVSRLLSCCFPITQKWDLATSVFIFIQALFKKQISFQQFTSIVILTCTWANHWHLLAYQYLMGHLLKLCYCTQALVYTKSQKVYLLKPCSNKLHPMGIYSNSIPRNHIWCGMYSDD